MRPTLGEVTSRLAYDPETGIFTLLQSGGRKRAGDVAGYLKADGYRLISINGRWQYAHRLAWFITSGSWPAGEIDHINRQRDDNRIENLRECSRSENMANSCHKGWHRCGNQPVWQALIRVNRRRIYLGRFKTEEEARLAYRAAALKYHGAFALERPPPEEQAPLFPEAAE